MLQQHDWNDTPDSAVVPPDLYTLTVISADRKDSASGKLMLNVASRVETPAAWAGTTVFCRYVLGTEEDKQADRPETWKRRSARELKKLLAAANGGNLAALTGNIPQDVERLIGKTYCAILDVEVDNDPASQYKGSESQRFLKYFAQGDPKMPAAGTVRVATRPGNGPPTARPDPQQTERPSPPEQHLGEFQRPPVRA